MEFGLTLKTNIKNERSLDGVRTLSDCLEAYFIDRNYGMSVKLFVIGVLIINFPGFEDRFQKSKPKYIKKKTVSPDGIETTLESVFEYGIKIESADKFEYIDEKEASKIVAMEILDSLRVLGEMKKKIGDFDVERFKTDMKIFLLENGYLN